MLVYNVCFTLILLVSIIILCLFYYFDVTSFGPDILQYTGTTTTTTTTSTGTPTPSVYEQHAFQFGRVNMTRAPINTSFPISSHNLTETLLWIDQYDMTITRAQHEGGILITFVTQQDIELLLNWLCYVRGVNLFAYLIVAMDQQAFNTIKAWDTGVHVYHLPCPTCNPSSRATYTLVRLRTMIDILHSWSYPLILMDVDTIILHDVIPEFTKPKEDIVAQGDGQMLSTGQIWYKPSPNVFTLLEQVYTSLSSNQYDNEQQALNECIKKNDKLVTTRILDKELFANKEVLTPDRFGHISRGWFPASIHIRDNNSSSSTSMFKEYTMWQVDDVQKGTCMYDSYFNILPLPHKPKLSIHLLAYKRMNSLKRLLLSLEKSHYDNRTIDVYCHFDIPIDRNDVATMALIQQSATYFRDEWIWKYGHKYTHIRDQHVGQNYQYFQLWDPPKTNDEVIIVLQDDEVMSPYWYIWSRAAIDKYYGYDPFMFGISLQHQWFVAGRGAGPTGPVLPGDDPRGSEPVRWKRDNKPLLNQQLGTWGQIFFPAPYRLFQRYVWTHINDSILQNNYYDMDLRYANLESNGWFNSEYYHARSQVGRNDKGQEFWKYINWEYWYMSMTAEYGLYNMYSDFSGGFALCVNMQEAGDHYAADVGADSTLMDDTKWNPQQHLNFPEPDEILNQQAKIFDFWMRPVYSKPILRFRGFAMHKYWKNRQLNITPKLPNYT